MTYQLYDNYSLKVKTDKKEAIFFPHVHQEDVGSKFNKGEVMAILNVLTAWPFRKWV